MGTSEPFDPGASTVDAAAQARRREELEALYDVSLLLSSPLELAEKLRRALGRVVEVFGFSAGVVRLLDAATGDLLLAAHTGLPESFVAALTTTHAGEAPGGLSVQHRGLVVVEDLAESPYAASDWARAGYRTFVSVPLGCTGMLLGCVNITARRVLALSAGERQLLDALAGQLALAAANAELFHVAQRKIEYLSALHQYSRDIGPAPALDRVLRLTAERMAGLLRLRRTAVLCCGPDGVGLVGAAAYGFPAAEVLALAPPPGSLPAAERVLRDEELRLFHNAAAEGLLPAAFAHAHGVRGALAVPLVAHDEPLGLLLGDLGGEPLRLSADEMDLAMIFANQASVWIAGARSFEREQEARAKAEAAEARYREFLELAPDAILVMGRDGRINLVNSQAERLFDYPRAELLGRPIEMLLPARFRDDHVEHRERYFAEPRTRPMGAGVDLFALRRDGAEIPVEISLSPTVNADGIFVTSVIRDITDRRLAAQERELLLASAQEKSEQLKLAVREAHHRIKNNLQAISDLLYLELASGGGASAEVVLQESVERIQSIALVHDLLSQDENVQTVDLRAMAERLVPMVLSAGSTAAAGLDLRVPSFPVSSKKATTLALILNELVSNAAKHALHGRPEGRLEVRVEEGDDGLRLRVRDNGPGLPAGFDPRRDANVGLQVVRTLAERDLGGTLSLSAGPGLLAEVWFPW